MRKQAVLLLVESLGTGGCERDAAKIALGLDRERFEPHVGVFQTGGFLHRRLSEQGVPVFGLPVRSFLNSTLLDGARIMGEYIRDRNIALVHAYDVPLDIFGAPVAAWNRVPAIVTSQLSYRNMYPLERRIALRVTDFLADKVVVNSRAVGDSLEREWGFPKHKLALCYNGVDLTEFVPGPGVRPFAGGELVVGSVCVLRPEKRMDWVLRAFAALAPQFPSARLMLVGSGPELPRYEALRDELGIAHLCRFEPMQEKVADWMRGMDVYINSSRSESFPNALLEAMACGCCVIGSRVGGIPELISHRENGLLFDSAKQADLTDMLRLALEDASLRNRMRHQALETARQRFSIQIAVNRTQSIYDELLGTRSC